MDAVSAADDMVQSAGHLLHGLKDKDTVVRWSAAKGSVAKVIVKL